MVFSSSLSNLEHILDRPTYTAYEDIQEYDKRQVSLADTQASIHTMPTYEIIDGVTGTCYQVLIFIFLIIIFTRFLNK